MSFQNFIILCLIDIGGKVTFTKLQTISLKQPMQAILCGLATIFSPNDDNAFVCSHDFDIERNTLFENKGADVPFLSSLSKFDFYTFTKGGGDVVLDRHYQQIFQSNKFQGVLRGLTFDLHDNVLVCCRTNKRSNGEETKAET